MGIRCYVNAMITSLVDRNTGDMPQVSITYGMSFFVPA